MLFRSAERVYAVDVGECAFSEDLKNNPKVVVKDRTNARYINMETFGEYVDFVCVDVSFISLKLILPAVFNILKKGGDTIALIKPQFEAGNKFLSKNGIVLSDKIRRQVCREIEKFAIDLGFIYMNGMTMMSVGTYWQDIIIGFVLIFSVSVDAVKGGSLKRKL